MGAGRPTTSTGVGRCVVDPSPSSPDELPPHATGRPPTLANVKCMPPAIDEPDAAGSANCALEPEAGPVAELPPLQASDAAATRPTSAINLPVPTAAITPLPTPRNQYERREAPLPSHAIPPVAFGQQQLNPPWSSRLQAAHSVWPV